EQVVAGFHAMLELGEPFGLEERGQSIQAVPELRGAFEPLVPAFERFGADDGRAAPNVETCFPPAPREDFPPAVDERAVRGECPSQPLENGAGHDDQLAARRRQGAPDAIQCVEEGALLETPQAGPVRAPSQRRPLTAESQRVGTAALEAL